MRRSILILLALVALATAALADPACYPVQFGGPHASFTQSEVINLTVGQFAAQADDPSQRWRQVLFGRRQDQRRPWLVLHWPLNAPLNWPWTVVPIWCRDTGEIAILAINTNTIETKIVTIYHLGRTWQISLVRAGPSSVTIHLSDRATEGRVGRDETVHWPKKPVLVKSACLTHLLLRQRIVAEVLAIGRRLGAGKTTVTQVTTGPVRLLAYLEEAKLGREHLMVSDLVVDEPHHVAHLMLSTLFASGDGPFSVELGYDYQAKRLVEPPANYRQLHEQDCYL